jgi:chromosome partitioning protein
MRKIAFINEKGGTCKTTLAVNVAAYLAKEKGMRVLLVDLDTQGHAGKCLGLDVRTLTPNVFHWLTHDRVSLETVAQPTAIENLHVIPSYKDMSEFPLAVANDSRRVYRLADRLAAAEGRYDAVMFDAPPSMGITTFNILAAALEVVVPVAMTYLSLDGCAEIAETIRRVALQHGRPDLHLSLVVPTLYRKTALADEIHARLQSHFPEALCATPLGFNVKIDEAQSHGQTIWEYAPRSKGAEMLAEISEEILRRGMTTQATLADVA